MMATCIKCRAAAKHDPIDGVLTTCGRHSKAHAERMRKLHADPEFNPLAAITEAERADYDVLRKASPGPDRWKQRSRFFPGLAAAMAHQWGDHAARAYERRAA